MREYYYWLRHVIDQTKREAELWDLAGLEESTADECEMGEGDGPHPYTELINALEAAIEEVQALRGHKHAWDQHEYCSICGADGRA